jgi:hypothetical protein
VKTAVLLSSDEIRVYVFSRCFAYLTPRTRALKKLTVAQTVKKFRILWNSKVPTVLTTASGRHTHTHTHLPPPYDAISHTASNEKINQSWTTGTDLDGGGRGLFEGAIPTFTLKGWRCVYRLSYLITLFQLQDDGKMTVNAEWVRIWKKVVVFFRTFFRHLPGEAEENKTEDSSIPDRD